MNIPAKMLPVNPAWKIEESLDLYQVEAWGKGYFSINDQGHVVMPSAPTAALIMIQAEFLLELLIILLDFPARFGDLYEAPKAVIGRQVAEEIPGRLSGPFWPFHK